MIVNKSINKWHYVDGHILVILKYVYKKLVYYSSKNIVKTRKG